MDAKAMKKQLYLNENSITCEVLSNLYALTEKQMKKGVTIRDDAKVANLSQQFQQQKQYFLPFWPDAVRPVPNSILRSALFGISRVRKTCKNEIIASNIDLQIRFTGEKFNQIDLDVFQGLLHLAMRQSIFSSIEFDLALFLRLLGRLNGGLQKKQLNEELRRLKSGVVEISWLHEKKTFIGSLLQKIIICEASNRYIVYFDPDLMKLFEFGYSYIDHQHRLQLGQHGLAKWLHGYYSSHTCPYGYKIMTLQKLTGSTAKPKEFKRLLAVALDKLVVLGTIKSWYVEEQSDLIKVTKMPIKTKIKVIH